MTAKKLTFAKNQNMQKIGVLGAGHLGKIHLSCIKEIKRLKLVGFFDPDPEISSKIESEFGIERFNSVEDLISASDIVDIVTPTVSHFDCANQSLRKFKHVFIEKPVVTSLQEARALIELANEANVKVQVGHVERFNPAFLAAREHLTQPMFIETHRLAQFNPRGTDVPVVLDLMIHDIDIVLSVLKTNIRKINASGVAIVSDTPDIANARIEFDNGCVANLTASRISMKDMRKSRFFQRDAYIAVDFLKKDVEIVRLRDRMPSGKKSFTLPIELGKDKGTRFISIEKPEVKPINAIKTELESFLEAIEKNTTPPVTITDGYQALEVAHKIMEKIN